MPHAWMVIFVLRSEILATIFLPLTKCFCTSSCEIISVCSARPLVHVLINNLFGCNSQFTDKLSRRKTFIPSNKEF
ncbi:uncharacterized protein BJ212DRAFT_537871 [Suillus subaureus]|uniref:Secreted protein n=1 Tax=Suillus subaureus TaxID=48587 RepID=A0A9P7EKQ9_9AGAM|nr:uncharacterized protein BJ212DRAFT_537871 [Suillus subaureus]KAG1824598.1 hypothetical protein BJ212DRAFT_537871 [Suillus subaureus]